MSYRTRTASRNLSYLNMGSTHPTHTMLNIWTLNNSHPISPHLFPWGSAKPSTGSVMYLPARDPRLVGLAMSVEGRR